MELVHIELKNFKRFNHFEASFSRGLNVVRGPNESGKSTLHEAIIVGLLDRPTGKQSERKHQTWGEERLPEIDLTYQMPDGELYKVHKDYQAQEFEMTGPDGNDTSRSGLERAIQSALGTISEKLYSSTACIRQDAMMDLEQGEKEISDQLQQIAMGGVSGVNEVIRRLASKVIEFERGWKTNAPQNPGPIKQLREQVADVEGQIRRIRPEVDRREKAKDELVEQREHVIAIERELKPLHELHSAYTQRQELIQALEIQRRVERELEEKLEKVEGVEKRRQLVQKRLENLGSFTQVDISKEKELQKANELCKARSAEVADRERYISELKMQMEGDSKPKKRQLWIAIALFILGSMLGSSGVLSPRYLSPKFTFPLLITGGVLAFASMLWLIVLIMFDVRKKQNLRTRLLEARARHKRGLDALDAVKGQMEKLLEGCGCDSWVAFEEKVERFHHLQAELKVAETTLAALLSEEQTPQQLVEKRKEASRARRDIQEQLKEFMHTPELSSIEFQKIVSAIESLENELRERQEKILKLEALSEAGGANLEDLYCLQERRATIQHRLEVALDRHKIYRLALDGLQKVHDHILKNAQRELEPRLGGYLDRLTRGRYKKVFIDQNLKLDVSINSKKRGSVGVQALSDGARDQVYMAARLALCDMIFKNTQPPLLLDDPFVTFDPIRQEAALQLCKELSQDRQIVLFTCHDGYDPYADNIIELT